MSMRIEVNGIAFDVIPGGNKPFWRKVNSGRWERETFAVFDRHISPEALVVDIGAWIGPTALYAVQKGAGCIAFEPDPIAFRDLAANVEANRDADWAERLKIENAGISADGQPFTLGSRAEGGDSMSSMLFSDRNTAWEVSSRRLEDVLAEHAGPDQPVFVKIDIEGGEYALLPAIAPILAAPRVTSVISFHPKFLRNVLRRQHGPEGPWRDEFTDRHLAVLDALPWTRQLAFGEGDVPGRAELEAALRENDDFPKFLLIT